MYSHLMFIALDVARERAQEATEARLAAEFLANRPIQDGFVVRVRRELARRASAIARLANPDGAANGVTVH